MSLETFYFYIKITLSISQPLLFTKFRFARLYNSEGLICAEEVTCYLERALFSSTSFRKIHKCMDCSPCPSSVHALVIHGVHTCGERPPLCSKPEEKDWPKVRFASTMGFCSKSKYPGLQYQRAVRGGPATKQPPGPAAATILVPCQEWGPNSKPMPKSSEFAVVILSMLQSPSKWVCKPAVILKTISRGAAERRVLYCIVRGNIESM